MALGCRSRLQRCIAAAATQSSPILRCRSFASIPHSVIPKHSHTQLPLPAVLGGRQQQHNLVWLQRRHAAVDGARAEELDRQIAEGVQAVMWNDIKTYAVTKTPAAGCSSYMTLMSGLVGGHWPAAVALSVLSMQPLLWPLAIYGRMRSVSVERALCRHSSALDEYSGRLKVQYTYDEAWRVYRSKRNMLKDAGLWLPHKFSLGFLEIPLVATMAFGGWITAYTQGNLGSWLWLADFGAADPTYLSSVLFFSLYIIRLVIGSPKKWRDLRNKQTAMQVCVSVIAAVCLNDTPAIVFWVGIMHNMCMIPLISYLRRDSIYYGFYVPKMGSATQAIVRREREGKAYLLPHATKLVDRFAPEEGKRPLLLADFDPDKVPAPVLPVLVSGQKVQDSALAQVQSAADKRLAVEEARKGPKPKVRRR